MHASLSINLIPVFATLFAMAFLGERLHGFHLVGIAVIAAGSWLATSVAREPSSG